MVTFEEFQDNCKHMHYSCDRCCGTEFYPACHKPENKLKGSSWNKCDKEHCPYFGIEMKDVTISTTDGKIQFKANNVKVF